MSNTGIVILNNDLRLKDNPALSAALNQHKNIVPLYIWNEDCGSAQHWWLHQSLESLAVSLKSLGSDLILFRGAFDEAVDRIHSQFPVNSIHCNSSYTPEGIALEQKLSQYCRSKDIDFKRHPGNILIEPDEIMTQTGKPFSVYTPFWNSLIKKTIRLPLPTPRTLPPCPSIQSENLYDWKLKGDANHWSRKFDNLWQVGEDAAQDKLAKFLDTGVHNYHHTRDLPGIHGTSQLSPHLHFGEISARDVWHQVLTHQHLTIGTEGHTTFLKEIVWREFCAHLLYHNPNLKVKNFRPEFDQFPWGKNERHFEAWTMGQTGYPIIDAGMRELWATGWMHNRVRMIVASFLTKNLLIDWRQGEEWFWDTLIDADHASNAANWQWVAGSGADAAPYYRIFNPILQSEKFDPKGEYISRWIPELRHLHKTQIHTPWTANVKDYAQPIVDLKVTRDRALRAYKEYTQKSMD